uniref:DUF2971 domain-containing protein n=1 Tax=Cyanothece sp. (strain PCC 7425 / ATCC 29141) TaxID=395961 RepID=B8HQV6_CYAP4
MNNVLYKYRGLTNIQYALDIFINQRMFAAEFKKLNDPMEGIYLYEPGKLSKENARKIYDQKSIYRILSLSEEYNNMLMWSYYAEGHSGIVVGVTVSEPDLQVRRVEYVNDLSMDIDDGYDGDVAIEILSKKLKIWEHEKEHRVFSREKYIKVEIKELIFGVNTESETRELVENIARKFCSDIKISNINKSQLNKGELNRFL